MDTLDFLKSRHSVRSYTTYPLDDAIKNKLRSEVSYINTHEAGLNFQLCFDDSAPFSGWSRSYGMFRNVSDYMVAVVDPTFPHAYERAGYFAEQFVMEAVKAGLGTCFVGGTYSASHLGARVEVYEKVPFIVAFGQPQPGNTTLIARLSAGLTHRKTLQPRQFFEGDDIEYHEVMNRFSWLHDALEAVACAPSALNRQPVRLKMKAVESQPRIVAFTPDADKFAVDLGIAKYNVAAAVPGVWEWGENAPFYPDADSAG